MQITLQQYNSVVSGLRTQLELHRAELKERAALVASLTERALRSEQEPERNRNTIIQMFEELSKSHAQLELIKNCAANDCFPEVEANCRSKSEAYDCVRNRIEILKGKLEGMRPRRRK